MKFLVVLSVALACVAADVSHLGPQATIVKAEYEINPDNSYRYNSETSNGIYAQEEGTLKNVNNESPSIEVKGAYKYPSPDGTPIELSYIANEYGFQPQGSHLPVGPEIPEAIRRSIEYIRTHQSKQQ